MISDVDFTCKVDGENYEQWFGADDQSAGFEHQLNKGNTASVIFTTMYLTQINIQSKWMQHLEWKILKLNGL